MSKRDGKYQPRSLAKRDEVSRRSDSKRIQIGLIEGFAIATPLLWATGLLYPATGLVVLVLIWRIGVKAVVTSPLALPWYVVGLAQAVSAVINGIGANQNPGTLIYHLVATPVTGWVLIGVCLAIGTESSEISGKAIRGIRIVGVWILGAGVVSVGAWVGGIREIRFDTVLAQLMPMLKNVGVLWFENRMYGEGGIGGIAAPRLMFPFPWSNILGFAGIAMFFLGLSDRVRLFRRSGGLLAGILAILGSLGRAPIGAFLGCLLVYAVLRLRHKGLPLLAGVLFATALAVAALDVPEVLQNLYGRVGELREGSTTARELAYQLSVEGFLEKPILGQGWLGPPVLEGVPMPIGSHSTVFGLLYTGGAVTLGAYVGAIVVSVAMYTRQFLVGYKDAVIGVTVFLGFAAMGVVEGMYSFAVPCVLYFVALGGTYKDKRGITPT